MSNPRIRKLFLDIHMGLGHDGLVAIAVKNKIKINELSEEDLLMFMNKRGDKLKVLGAQGKVIGYLKLPNNRKIMGEALQYIPQTFGSSGFDYDQACRAALTRKLGNI
jgi:hypothetical protein